MTCNYSYQLNVVQYNILLFETVLNNQNLKVEPEM